MRVLRWDNTRRSNDFITTGHCDRSVVIKFCGLFLGGTGIMVEVLKQAGTWYVSSEVLKDVCEVWGQQVIAVLQDRRRDRVWPDYFVGVLCLEQFVDVTLWKDS